MTIEQPLLYKTTNNGQIDYYAIMPPPCEYCKETLRESAILLSDWRKDGSVSHEFYHHQCFGNRKRHPLSIIPETKIVIVSPTTPKGGLLVLLARPNFSIRKGEESDYYKLLGEKAEHLTSRAQYAGLLSWEGAMIGSDERLLLDGREDQEILRNIEEEAAKTLYKAATGKDASVSAAMKFWADLQDYERVEYLCPLEYHRGNLWVVFDSRINQKTLCDKRTFVDGVPGVCSYRSICPSYQKHKDAVNKGLGVYDDVVDVSAFPFDKVIADQKNSIERIKEMRRRMKT